MKHNIVSPVGSPPPAVGSPAPPAAVSAEERLKELKRLRESGLITEDVYLDQQRRVLELR